MTTAHEADSKSFTAGFASPPVATFDLASPQFRYPIQSAAAKKLKTATEHAHSESRPIGEIGGMPADTTIEAAQAALSGPHFQLLPVEQFVGWSMQDVAWTAAPIPSGLHPKPSEPALIQAPATVIAPESNPAKSRPEAIPVDTPLSSNSRIESPVEPTMLPSGEDDSEPGREAIQHWPTRSRAQVAGFAIQRTRFDQARTIVTGAGFASGHRRWAARNLSAEMQARTVAEQVVAEAARAQGQAKGQEHPEVTPAEIAKVKRAGQLEGGLPLLIHPDFRWGAVVDKLCQNQPLAQQLLLAAEQLIAGGDGRLLVAGARRGCGTTTLAATVSRLLIEQGKRVLMVDADLVQAGWTSDLELTSAGSWVNQVEAFEPLQEAMAISRKTNAAMVALQATSGRKHLPPYLLDYLGQLLRPLRDQFDATVIEVGPISQLLEELSQPSRLGSALLIVQQGGPDAAVELRRSKTTLNAFGITRLAVAQNFAGQ